MALLSEAQYRYEHDCVAQSNNHEARQDGAWHADLQTGRSTVSTQNQAVGKEPVLTTFLAMSGAR